MFSPGAAAASSGVSNFRTSPLTFCSTVLGGRLSASAISSCGVASITPPAEAVAALRALERRVVYERIARSTSSRGSWVSRTPSDETRCAPKSPIRATSASLATGSAAVRCAPSASQISHTPSPQTFPAIPDAIEPAGTRARSRLARSTTMFQLRRNIGGASYV